LDDHETLEEKKSIGSYWKAMVEKSDKCYTGPCRGTDNFVAK